jgi:nucleoside-diphosphate-sugar epimerase
MTDYPDKIENEEQLEEMLSRPGDRLTGMIRRLDGDIIFLGITGKIGPSLAMKASRACRKAGVKKRIMGISRTIDPELQKRLDDSGIETVRGDLLDPEFMKRLPAFKNVFFLAGMKFGSVENLPLTWAVNSYLPGLVADHFRGSRIVAFSTGCVYPLVTPGSGGSVETDQPLAVGEYAQSCLGRERMFEYGSKRYGTNTALIRLNYSVEMRYGVLVDIALKVRNGIPIDLSMGHFNVIWQGDMNDYVLRALEFAGNPARIINITGPEILSVREVALEFGNLMGRKPEFTGTEAPTSLLNNAAQAFSLFGMPEVPVKKVITWTAHWLNNDLKTLGKPTHYEVRDGNF